MSILSVPSSVANATSSSKSSSSSQIHSTPTIPPHVRPIISEDLLTVHYGQPLVQAIGLTALRELPEINGEAIQFTKENVPYISPEKMLSHKAVRGRYIDRHGHRFFIAYKFQSLIAGTTKIKALNIINLIIHKEASLHEKIQYSDFAEFTRIQMSYNADISAPNKSIKWNLKEFDVKKGLELFKKLLTNASTAINVNFKKASYSSYCSLTNLPYPPHNDFPILPLPPSEQKLYIFTGNESE